MNDRKGNEYHAMNNTIDKQLSSLKVPLQVLASSCLPQQILNFSSNLTSINLRTHLNFLIPQEIFANVQIN